MLGPQPGLVRVPTAQLERLLRAVVHAAIDCPLTIGELARHGLASHAEFILAGLRGLPAPAVRAVVIAVLAERMRADERLA